jgi:hypothetical protein
VDVNVPGVMAILVAPLVDQLSVLLEPEFMLSGTAAFMLPGEAANELIVGADLSAGADIDGVVEPQPASPAQANRTRTNALRSSPKDLTSGELGLRLQEELVEPIKVNLQFGTSAFNRNLCFFCWLKTNIHSNLPDMSP